MYKNCLIQNPRLNSKFMRHRLENKKLQYTYSPSAENKTIKFGHLVEYNMRNNFLEKSYTKFDEEVLIRDPFIKNQNLAYLWINNVKCCKVCFCCMSNSEPTKIY